MPLALVVRHLIEHKELSIRPKERLVCDTRRLHIQLGLASNTARVTGIALMSNRVTDVAENRNRVRKEWIHKSSLRIRNDQHVAFMDGLPPLHRGPVEPKPVLESCLRQLLNRDREVTLLSAKVSETKIDGTNFPLATQSNDFARRLSSRRHESFES